MNKLLVSSNHLAALRQELADAKASLLQLRNERALACEVSACASQNGHYLDQLAVDEGALVQRIARIQLIISSAEIYNPSVRNVERVCIGSIVRITRDYGRGGKGGKKATEIWEIIGHGETCMAKRQVAYDTPLGAVLLGMELGDARQANTPLGMAEFNVLGLYSDWDAAYASMAPAKLAAAAK